jgi:hypothetical protein
MTEEERRRANTEKAMRFYNQHLKNPVESTPSKQPEIKDPWWLKPLLILFLAFIAFGMVSMCNHSLKESSGVGIETTIKSHGD